ncbi:hypothetical protein P7L66_13330 [Tistrella mobilis]|uniref:hypothetical protein n=1 Tax=Tistrella mobilis TaxID=171437 RepID=UPI003556CFF1
MKRIALSILLAALASEAIAGSSADDILSRTYAKIASEARAEVAGMAQEGAQAKDLRRAGLDAVLRQLKDPDSAKFRDVRLVDHPAGGRVVCGEVNARNSYGGYVGFARFVAGPSLAFFEVRKADRQQEEVLNAGLDEACGAG